MLNNLNFVNLADTATVEIYTREVQSRYHYRLWDATPSVYSILMDSAHRADFLATGLTMCPQGIIFK